MRATPVPSVKKLAEIGIDDGQARLLRRVLQTNDTDKLEEIMDKHRTNLAKSRRWLHIYVGRQKDEECMCRPASMVVVKGPRCSAAQWPRCEADSSHQNRRQRDEPLLQLQTWD